MDQDVSLPEGAVFKLSRARLRENRVRTRRLGVPHLLWVQNGKARSAGENGLGTLHEREIVFFRAGDKVLLRALAEETWVGQIAISAPVLDALAQNYADLRGHFFWQEGPLPVRLRLSVQKMADFARRVRDLQSAALTPLSIHAFLLPLFTGIQRARVQPALGAPDWLVEALEALEQPEVYRSGSAGFVAVTGKSHAHVSRSVRKYLGCSPSDLVNASRMRAAAWLLSSTDEGLPAIAEATGIANLSYFHRLFHEHHALTPAAYRSRFGYGAIQPR